MNRDMRGTKRESTQCPIFLLQTVVCAFEYDCGDGGLVHGEDGEVYLPGTNWEDEDAEAMSTDEVNDYLFDHGLARREWTTHSGGVWFTREEAEAEAERRGYFYGRKGKDWRVYCVPAHGELAKLLDQHSDYE